MKKIILCVVIFILAGFAYATTFSPFREFQYEWEIERLNTTAQELLNTTTYTKEKLEVLDLMSFYGYSNFAYDICDRVKSFTTNEEILKFVKVYQSVALTRILVENGVINSIHQIPVESMGIFNHQTKSITYYIIDMPKEEKEKITKEIEQNIYNLLTGVSLEDSEEQEMAKEMLTKEGVTLDNYKEYAEKTVSEFSKVFENTLPEEYANEKYTTRKRTDFTAEYISQNHWEILDKITTLALVEKYPLDATRIFNDYLNKYGIDKMGVIANLIVYYFVNIKDFDTAIELCEIALNAADNIKSDNNGSLTNRENLAIKFNVSHDYNRLMAYTYAKAGNIDKALDIINYLMDDLEIDKENKKSYTPLSISDEKTFHLLDKILLYSYAEVENDYKKEIDQIKNEIIIISTEEEASIKYNMEILNDNIEREKILHLMTTLYYTNYSPESSGENVDITLAYMNR